MVVKVEIHINENDGQILALLKDSTVVASGYEHALDEAINEQFIPSFEKFLQEINFRKHCGGMKKPHCFFRDSKKGTKCCINCSFEMPLEDKP